jgi:hypothetical protein
MVEFVKLSKIKIKNKGLTSIKLNQTFVYNNRKNLLHLIFKIDALKSVLLDYKCTFIKFGVIASKTSKAVSAIYFLWYQ